MHWLFFFLLLVASTAHATIPGAASSDPDYALGYLHCDKYTGVVAGAGGNATTNTARFNECIQDAADNALAAYWNCGTYLINDTVKGYEWQNWVGGKAEGPEPKNFILRGSREGGCKPTLELVSGSTGFTNASVPRPALLLRSFWAKSSSAPLNGAPTTNLFALPAPGESAWRDGQANFFAPVIDNLKIDLNANAGAVGVSLLSAQNAGIYDIEVTGSSFFAGVYGLPGRNATTAKVTVTGGTHCIGNGGSWNVGLDNSIGPTIVGINCLNQSGTAVQITDTSPVTIIGLNITKNSGAANPAIVIDAPTVLQDVKIAMSGSGANALAIDNTDGFTMYGRNIYTSGTTALAKSVATQTNFTSSGTWARIPQYTYVRQFSKDSATNGPDVYPSYGEGETTFEVRSYIDGVLSQNAFPVAVVPANSSAPPDDLVTRHLWASIPTHEGNTFTNPADYAGCEPVIVSATNDGEDASTSSNTECTAGANAAIAAAATAGHNLVHLPRGYLNLTGPINLKPNTKLMGAGGTVNVLNYKSSWAPASETYMVTTDSNTSGTAFMGFLGMFARTKPATNMSFFHWRIGKASATMALRPHKQHDDPWKATNPLKFFQFSGGGGGKHYSLQGMLEQMDSDPNTRFIYVNGTSQPLSLYGQNVEITKAACGGSPTVCTLTPDFADAAGEITGASNVRWYGCKREGESPTLKVINSSNIAIYGCGAMAEPTRPGKGSWLQVSGSSDGVLSAVQIIRNTAHTPNGQFMITDQNSTSGANIPWPNGIAFYRKGQIDDAPFSDGSSPAPTSPNFQSATVSVADRLDVCWNIFDSTAMTPASGTNGWTVTVNGVGKSVTTSALVGLNCYLLNFAASTITADSDVVTVAYAPGNIKAGGAGTPDAEAFTAVTATNQLAPSSQPVLTQTAFASACLVGRDGRSDLAFLHR